MPRARKTTTDAGPQEPKSVAKAATVRRSRKSLGQAQPALAAVLTADEIARRAYELYEQSGYEHGQDLDHWLIAERELQRSQA